MIYINAIIYIVMKLDIDCIILAAGMSTRMTGWKMLLPYKGASIVESAIRNALMVCKRVIVVTGYRSPELINKLKHLEGVIFVYNIDYKKGMFSSVKIGIKSVKSDYFFISHGDLPLITPDIYQTLFKKRGAYALFPIHDNRRGHPVLLPKKIIKMILEEGIDSSMKKLLATYPTQLEYINTKNIYKDIDTDNEYLDLTTSSSN